jgi:hypothetical protein
MSREGLLVSVSRGRTKATIYTDDLEGLRQAVRRSEERLTATELLKDRAQRREREAEHVRHMQRWVRAAGEKAGALVRVFGHGLPGGQPAAGGESPGRATPAIRSGRHPARTREPGDDRPEPERTR